MSLSLVDIRQMLRVAGRNSSDPAYYKTAQLDVAILGFLADFLQDTRCVKTSFSIAINATTNEADFSTLTGFLSDRIERARILNNKRIITINGTPTSFTLTYDDQTTATLTLSGLTAAAVQTALTDLSNIGASDVVVTGTTGAGPFTAAFAISPLSIEALSGTIVAGGTDPSIDVDEIGDPDEDLTITSGEQVLNALVNDESSTPTVMGFEDSTTAKFYPAPEFNGTVEGIYCPIQTGFTIGTRGGWESTIQYYVGDVVSLTGNMFRALVDVITTATTDATKWEALGAGTLVAPASIVSVIPDGLLILLIAKAGPAYLHMTDPEHQSISDKLMRDYEIWKRGMSGVGSISGKVVSRYSLSPPRVLEDSFGVN